MYLRNEPDSTRRVGDLTFIGDRRFGTRRSVEVLQIYSAVRALYTVLCTLLRTADIAPVPRGVVVSCLLYS